MKKDIPASSIFTDEIIKRLDEVLSEGQKVVVLNFVERMANLRREENNERKRFLRFIKSVPLNPSEKISMKSQLKRSLKEISDEIKF